MKKILCLMLSLLMLITSISFVVTAEQGTPVQTGYMELSCEPVKLPNTEDGSWDKKEVKLFDDSENPIDFGDGALTLTFIIKASGVESPMSLSGFNVNFTCDKSVDTYAYKNNWGTYNAGLDGVGTEHPFALNIPRDGYYALTYNSKPFAMGNFDKKILTISSIGVMDPNSWPGKNIGSKNTNNDATIQLMAIATDNLAPQVSFYGKDGDILAENVTVDYQKVSKSDGHSAKKSTLKTPSAVLCEIEGVELPSKEPTATERYELVWKDKDGNIVDAVYKSGELYADFIAIDNTISSVKFVDEVGNTLKTFIAKKGDKANFDISAPAKESDGENAYFFKGWSIDGTNTIDLNKLTLTENEYVFSPIFVSDVIITATPVVGDIEFGGSTTVTVKLNRTDMTTDVFNGTKEPITSGEFVVTYSTALIDSPDVVAPGKIVVPFTAVSADGTTNATFTVKALEGVAGLATVTIHEGFATSATADKTEIVGCSSTFNIVGQQTGKYFTDPETVLLNKNEDGKAPAQQGVWEGEADFGSKQTGVTFVIKLDGIDTPIDVSYMNFGFDGTAFGNANWFWNQAWSGAEEQFRYQSFPESGCYYIYYNKRINEGRSIQKVTKLTFFSGSDARKGNENENATFQMLAIVAKDLQPTVTFRNTDGSVIATVQHKYTDVGNSTENGKLAKQTGKLISASDLFATLNDVAIPTKSSDNPKIEYEFDYWMDAEGNPVDAVYMDSDVYPHFKTIDRRTSYNVIFKNHDGSELYSCTVKEGEIPVFPTDLPTPKKPSTDANSFEFIGWTPEIAAAPLAPEGSQIQGEDIVYTATYKEVERRYDVTFYLEDGETFYAESLNIIGGGAAVLPDAPVKENSVGISYTFAKWVDLNGGDVDLTNVTSDLKVKPYFESTVLQCIVTFVDSDRTTVLKELKVDYDTAATTEAPTKDADTYYTYAFDKWVDENVNAVDLSKVTADVTVYASYKATYNHPFTGDNFDSFADWMKPAIEYIVANGIMNGMGDSFAPNANMNRGMVVTVLWRYEGQPEAKDGYNCTFNDLVADWYIPAVKWAASYGVVNGRSEATFDPSGNVTREEFAAILYRFADSVKNEYMSAGTAKITDFGDANKISSWAESAVKWAYASAENLSGNNYQSYNKTRYITGKGVDSEGKPLFDPKGNATRAEVATMLYRYMSGERISKGELDVFTSDIITTYPSVYAVEDEYQIFLLVNKECTMWVEVNGTKYYDHSNGILRSDTFLHKATVPMDILNNAEEYTVHVREIINRKPYYTETGEVESYSFAFKPITEKESYNIINLADSHSTVNDPISAGSFYGDELDLLIMNGDIIDHSDNINSFKNIYQISGGITKGQVPCIYSRGNHELRGVNAEHLAEYTPTSNGKSYYTVDLGPIWCIVLDAGEDKDDSHAEYGNTVACNAFRAEEEKFLEKVIASHDYDDASHRLIISHDPFCASPTHSLAEPARMKKWCSMLKEIDATLWLSGHLHREFLQAPGDIYDRNGYPCLVLTSSNGKEDFRCGAVNITEHQVSVKYVNKHGDITKTESLPVL